MITTITDFLDSSTYNRLKGYSQTCEFKDEVNEVDGVTYPYICRDIPDDIKQEILDKLTEILGIAPENPVMFMRMSPEGVKVPHFAHTDTAMGAYSFMLYLHDSIGTLLLRHCNTGMTYKPELDAFIEILKNDQNSMGAWAPYMHVNAKQNLAAVFDANLIHAAGPSFGKDQKDARIVLTCFFN